MCTSVSVGIKYACVVTTFTVTEARQFDAEAQYISKDRD